MEINAVERNSRLPQTAPGMQRDLERAPHPFRLLLQMLPDLHNLRVRQFRLLRHLVSPQFEANQWVGFCVPQPDRLPQEQREGFQFHNGRIASHCFPGLLLVGRAPLQVFERVAVRDVPRRMEVTELQPKRQPLPGTRITFQRAWALTMPLQKLRHPGIPTVAESPGGAGEFLRFHLRAQGAGLDGFSRMIRPHSGGLVAALAVGVDELDEPERGALFTVERGHDSECS